MKNLLIRLIVSGPFIFLIPGMFIYDQFTKRSYDFDDCLELDNENLCLAHGRTCGFCEMLLGWYEYDAESNSCVKHSGGGCEGVFPFRTLEECEDACVN